MSLSDIDLEDRRFQYRISEKITDLIPSLATEGQLIPVVLWGKEAPFKILDGFRLYPIRFVSGAPAKSRTENRKIREEALEIIKAAESNKTDSKNP